MSKPARNATGKEAPGQIVNALDDYYFADQLSQKKMTFEEWLHHRFPAGVGRFTLHDDSDLANTLYQCWKTAQENV